MRDNEERLRLSKNQDSPAMIPTQQIEEDNEVTPPQPQMSFSAPTQFVELPSRGRFYPKDHPLHNQESLEIRFMTAKEEDILTSKTLLKKGIVIDRLIQSVLIDKKINIDDLLIGDKNALIVETRITGYGAEYITNVMCPSCGTNNKYEFNLDNKKTNYVDQLNDGAVENAENGTFFIVVPKTKAKVEVRLLTGHDEKAMARTVKNKSKYNLPEASLTDHFKQIIISVNDDDSVSYVSSFVENMPALDSKYLRTIYEKVVPNVDLKQDFICTACNYEETMEVPFTTDFFWPR